MTPNAPTPRPMRIDSRKMPVYRVSVRRRKPLLIKAPDQEAVREYITRRTILTITLIELVKGGNGMQAKDVNAVIDWQGNVLRTG